MFNPLITLKLKTLASDHHRERFTERIPELYAGAEPVYYDPVDSIETFRQGAHFTTCLQQWRILTEQIKQWMQQHGIRISRATSVNAENGAANTQYLNQDQILDRFINKLGDATSAYDQITPQLFSSGKKNAEVIVCLLKNTEKPFNARTTEPLLIEFIEGILMCSAQCMNSIQSLHEKLYQHYTQDLQSNLLLHKTELVKKIILQEDRHRSSIFKEVTHLIASLLYPQEEQWQQRHQELAALRGGDQVHVVCLLQEMLAHWGFVTLYDPYDYFKNNLLHKIQKVRGEEIVRLGLKNVITLLGQQYHPTYIINALVDPIIDPIHSLFPSSSEDYMMIREQAEKWLGLWGQQITFGHMLALKNTEGKTYLNKARLQDELRSVIIKALFQSDYFDDHYIKYDRSFFYVEGHLQLSWISRLIALSERQVVIQPDASVEVIPSHTADDGWTVPDFYDEKIFLTPHNWKKLLPLSQQMAEAFDFLLQNPTSIRNILIEMYTLHAEKQHFIYLLRQFHLNMDRDILNLLWYILNRENDLVAQEEIRVFISEKIGLDQTIQLLRSAPSHYMNELPHLLRESAHRVESLIDFICSIGNCDFSSTILKKQTFKAIILHGDFSRAQLTDSSFEECDLKNVNFREAILERTTFAMETNLYGVDFWGANLKAASFTSVSLEHVKNLDQAILGGCQFHLTPFSKEQLTYTNIKEALKRKIEGIIYSKRFRHYISDSRAYSWLIDICKALSHDHTGLIIQLLTATDALKNPFLHIILEHGTLIEWIETPLIELIHAILIPESPLYLVSATELLQAMDFSQRTILHLLIEKNEISLFKIFCAILDRINTIHSPIAFSILSFPEHQNILHYAIEKNSYSFVEAILEIVDRLPDELRTFFLFNNKKGFLEEAVKHNQEAITTRLCQTISTITHPIFLKTFLLKRDLDQLTLLDIAIRFSSPQIVNALLGLLDKYYTVHPHIVLAILFGKKVESGTLAHSSVWPVDSVFSESFVQSLSSRLDRQLILNRFLKTFTTIGHLDIFVFPLSSGETILEFAIKNLSENHIKTLLAILQKSIDIEKAIALLTTKNQAGIRLLDRLIQHPSSKVRKAAMKVYSTLRIALKKEQLTLCRLRSSTIKRAALIACNDEALRQEVEPQHPYASDSPWEISERELSFLLDLTKTPLLLTTGKAVTVPSLAQPTKTQAWIEHLTRTQRDHLHALYTFIWERLKEKPPLLQDEFKRHLINRLSYRRHLFLIEQHNHLFFLMSNPATHRISYVIYDQLLFREPKVFANLLSLKQALIVLYQIDIQATKSTYHAYDMQVLDPHHHWHQRARNILLSIQKTHHTTNKRFIRQHLFHNYFSLQGQTILSLHSITHAKISQWINTKQLQFRSEDFLKQYHLLSTAEILKIQNILKKYQKRHATHIPFDLKQLTMLEKQQAYWNHFLDVFLALPATELTPKALYQHISRCQINYLLKTEHFHLSAEQQKALLTKTHSSLASLVEHNMTRARHALMWLQALIGTAHGDATGLTLLQGLEGYQRLAAPHLTRLLTNHPYINRLFGASFSTALGQAVAAGPGMVLALIPIGEGIAKMTKHSIGSLDFMEGMVECASGIGFLASNLIPSPIGLFIDIALIASTIFASGKLGIKRLEQEGHVVLEGTILNKLLVGLGFPPATFTTTLQQASFQSRVSQVAETLLRELQSYYQMSLTHDPGEPNTPPIPVMVYSWPIYQKGQPRIISKEQYDYLKVKYPDMVVKWPDLLPRYVLQEFYMSPNTFSLASKAEAISSDTESILADHFSASIHLEEFRYLHGPTQEKAHSKARYFQSVFNGEGHSAAFTLKNTSIQGTIPPMDLFFPWVDRATYKAHFNGRPNDTLTIIGNFACFPKDLYQAFYPPPEKTFIHTQYYKQVTFKHMMPSESSAILDVQLTQVEQLIIDLRQAIGTNMHTPLTFRDQQITLGQKVVFSWHSSSFQSLYFFSAPNTPSSIVVPTTTPSHIQLPSLPTGYMHDIHAFLTHQSHIAIIKLEGPNAEVRMQLEPSSQFNLTYKGLRGPALQCSWRHQNNQLFPLLNWADSDLSHSFTFQKNLSHSPILTYEANQAVPASQLKMTLQAIPKVFIFGLYQGYPARFTLSGREGHILVSLMIPHPISLQSIQQLRRSLLIPHHAYHIHVLSKRRIIIGAFKKNRLQSTLLALKEEQDPDWQQIDIYNGLSNETLWILPGLAKKIILQHVTKLPSLSLHLVSVNQVYKKKQDLYLVSHTNTSHPQQASPSRHALYQTKIILKNYFAKPLPLLLNHIPYAVKQSEQPASAYLYANMSAHHIPYELRQSTLVKACQEIHIGNTSWEEAYFTNGLLRFGSISIHLTSLEKHIQVTTAHDTIGLSVRELRMLRHKMILRQENKYRDFFEWGMKHQNLSVVEDDSLSISIQPVQQQYSRLSLAVPIPLEFAKSSASCLQPFPFLSNSWSSIQRYVLSLFSSWRSSSSNTSPPLHQDSAETKFSSALPFVDSNLFISNTLLNFITLCLLRQAAKWHLLSPEQIQHMQRTIMKMVTKQLHLLQKVMPTNESSPYLLQCAQELMYLKKDFDHLCAEYLLGEHHDADIQSDYIVTKNRVYNIALEIKQFRKQNPEPKRTYPKHHFYFFTYPIDQRESLPHRLTHDQEKQNRIN